MTAKTYAAWAAARQRLDSEFSAVLKNHPLAMDAMPPDVVSAARANNVSPTELIDRLDHPPAEDDGDDIETLRAALKFLKEQADQGDLNAQSLAAALQRLIASKGTAEDSPVLEDPNRLANEPATLNGFAGDSALRVRPCYSARERNAYERARQRARKPSLAMDRAPRKGTPSFAQMFPGASTRVLG
jgi:hypothetical protein